MNRKADFVVFYMDIEHQSSGTLENVKHVKITSSSDAKPLYGLINNGLRSFFKKHTLIVFVPTKSRYIFFFVNFTLLGKVGN